MDHTNSENPQVSTSESGGDVASRLEAIAAGDPAEAPAVAEALADDLADALDRVGDGAAPPEVTAPGADDPGDVAEV